MEMFPINLQGCRFEPRWIVEDAMEKTQNAWEENKKFKFDSVAANIFETSHDF